MFQFPNLFPRFEDTRPVDVSATVDEAPKANGDATSADKEKGKDTKPDIKPDIKPTPAQLRGNAKKFGIKPPEGRIGSLVVMKSGRVKMVLGEGIVMDVSAHFILFLGLFFGLGLTSLGLAWCGNYIPATTSSPR